MRRRNTKLRAINLISVIFFLLAAVFYLVNERYPFLAAQQSNEAVPVATIHDGDTISVILHK